MKPAKILITGLQILHFWPSMLILMYVGSEVISNTIHESDCKQHNTKALKSCSSWQFLLQRRLYPITYKCYKYCGCRSETEEEVQEVGNDLGEFADIREDVIVQDGTEPSRVEQAVIAQPTMRSEPISKVYIEQRGEWRSVTSCLYYVSTAVVFFMFGTLMI